MIILLKDASCLVEFLENHYWSMYIFALIVVAVIGGTQDN